VHILEVMRNMYNTVLIKFEACVKLFYFIVWCFTGFKHWDNSMRDRRCVPGISFQINHQIKFCMLLNWVRLFSVHTIPKFQHFLSFGKRIRVDVIIEVGHGLERSLHTLKKDDMPTACTYHQSSRYFERKTRWLSKLILTIRILRTFCLQNSTHSGFQY
jgi:hypothetical protein